MHDYVQKGQEARGCEAPSVQAPSVHRSSKFQVPSSKGQSYSGCVRLRPSSAAQDCAVGQNGAKSTRWVVNQGKSREIKPPRGEFFLELVGGNTETSAVPVYESCDNGLTRSRSFGSRGLLASPRLLSPPPRRLKSTNLTFKFGRRIRLA